MYLTGFPGAASGKELAGFFMQESKCRHGFSPWIGKISWKKAWKPTPVFLPGESHGQRNLAGYSPQVTKNQNQLSNFHFSLFIQQISGKGPCTRLFIRSESELSQWENYPRVFAKNNQHQLFTIEVARQSDTGLTNKSVAKELKRKMCIMRCLYEALIGSKLFLGICVCPRIPKCFLTSHLQLRISTQSRNEG